MGHAGTWCCQWEHVIGPYVAPDVWSVLWEHVIWPYVAPDVVGAHTLGAHAHPHALPPRSLTDASTVNL